MLFIIALSALYWDLSLCVYMTSKYFIKWMYYISLTNPLLLGIRLIPIFGSYNQFLSCLNILNQCHSSKRAEFKKYTTNSGSEIMWHSTPDLNFIFPPSGCFKFLSSFFSVTKPFSASKHSPSWFSLPSQLFSYPFFWNHSLVPFYEVHSCSMLSFAFIHSPFVLLTHSVLWSLLYKRHTQGPVGIKGWELHIQSPKGIQSLIGDARDTYTVVCR